MAIDRGRTYIAVGHISNEDAERIGTFLEEKVGEDGVDAAEMVRLAKPKRSPIHQDFEWDDTIAGQEFRLEQARRILRSIKVVYVEGEVEKATRAFHHVVVSTNGDTRKAYVPAKIVWETPDLAAQVIEDARKELASWAARYKEYSHLSEAYGLIIEAIEKLDQLEIEDDEEESSEDDES